ncbi:MAG: membrane protein insertion efficiency factor YidD [Proteobacteria bacterium]|nr:membrane protein insertion efficiency factor YidD [Pseudomonadota bacterium]
MMRSTLKVFVYFYRLFISPILQPRCRFLPTCSEYALDALDRYGPYKGSILALKRICRCHPWGGHGFDPVKEE